MNFGCFYLEMVELVIKPVDLGSDSGSSFAVFGRVFVIHYQVCDFGLLVHG
jgi:hypothetical protein